MSQGSFDLKTALAEWRRQMLAGGITKSADLDELESHLHEDIDKLIELGLPDSEAFTIATQRIGQPALIRNEFKKIDHQGKYRAVEFILAAGLSTLAFSTTDKPDIALRFLLGVGLVSYIEFALIRSRFLNRVKLTRIRPYALIANIIFGALLAGPQIIFQALTALILQIFFEIDVWHAGLQERHPAAVRK